jgi:hypothetical protein
MNPALSEVCMKGRPRISQAGQFDGAHAKSRTAEEPCEGKLCAMVRTE